MNENENRKKLHRLLDAVLDANGLEERTQEKTGLKPTVFFEFSGHVAECDIRVYDEGWARDLRTWNMGFNFMTDNDIPDEKVEKTCSYLKTVSLPKKEKKEEALLRSMIKDKEKSIDKATTELEKLRKMLAEVKDEH